MSLSTLTVCIKSSVILGFSYTMHPDKQQTELLWLLSHACMVLADDTKIPMVISAHLAYQRSKNAGYTADSK